MRKFAEVARAFAGTDPNDAVAVDRFYTEAFFALPTLTQEAIVQALLEAGDSQSDTETGAPGEQAQAPRTHVPLPRLDESTSAIPNYPKWVLPTVPQLTGCRRTSGRLVVGEYAHASFRIGLLERGRRVLWARLRAAELPNDPEKIESPDDIERTRSQIFPVIDSIYHDSLELSQDEYFFRFRQAALSPSHFDDVFVGPLRTVLKGEGADHQIADSLNQFGIGIAEFVHLFAIYVKEASIQTNLLEQDSNSLRCLMPTATPQVERLQN